MKRSAEALVDLVKHVKVFPNWTLDARLDSYGNNVRFTIIARVPDAYAPENIVPIQHTEHLPLDAYGEQSEEFWLHFIWDKCRTVVLHELGEFFMVDGVRTHDPHARERELDARRSA